MDAVNNGTLVGHLMIYRFSSRDVLKDMVALTCPREHEKNAYNYSCMQQRTTILCARERKMCARFERKQGTTGSAEECPSNENHVRSHLLVAKFALKMRKNFNYSCMQQRTTILCARGLKESKELLDQLRSALQMKTTSVQ